jgi:hypothetical protein
MHNLEKYSPWEQAARKSCLINIFRADPWLSRSYIGFAKLKASNPNQFSHIEIPSEIISVLNLAPAPKGQNTMPLNPNIRLCTHIKVNGVPCGSPALHNEVFCYFHQRMIRGVRTPAKSRLHPIACIEDEHSIQTSLMEVINALVCNTIDFKRATLILRALHIAVKNSPRVHFQYSQSDMVQQVPDYPAPPVVENSVKHSVKNLVKNPVNVAALSQARALAEIEQLDRYRRERAVYAAAAAEERAATAAAAAAARKAARKAEPRKAKSHKAAVLRSGKAVVASPSRPKPPARATIRAEMAALTPRRSAPNHLATDALLNPPAHIHRGPHPSA